GDEVIVLPGGIKSTVSGIELDQQSLDAAENGRSVILHLADDIDISRGDFIVQASHPAETARNFEAHIAWFDQKPLDTTQVYLLQNHSRVTRIKVAKVAYKYDVNTQERLSGEEIRLNDMGKVWIKAANEVVFDTNDSFPENARAILIDPRTNITVGAVIIQAVA
ncbi:MAG: sulfate adenylyltransferase, partial [Leadbetterella sp.]|nr:sulfate adenylyltransferase [Leadbetterella sp.]